MGTLQVTIPNRKEFSRRAHERLRELQPSLLPEHADDFIAVEPDSGEYVLGHERREVGEEFRRRFPGRLSYLFRVDGDPLLRVPWVK